MMLNYAMVNQRVRFLKGFDDTALADFNSQLFSVMGEKGIAHRKFPLRRSILRSPDLLQSSAFGRAKDIEQVPVGPRDFDGSRPVAQQVLQSREGQ